MESNQIKMKATIGENSHAAILGVIAELSAGPKILRQLVQELSNNMQFRTASCIYKREIQELNKSSSSELICCFRVSTQLSSSEILQIFKKIAIKYLRARIFLLAFDQTVLMLPEHTLPHPYLASDTALLRCAGEVWGEYEHPILAQTLNKLVDSSASDEKIEFFSQGLNLT